MSFLSRVPRGGDRGVLRPLRSRCGRGDQSSTVPPPMSPLGPTAIILHIIFLIIIITPSPLSSPVPIFTHCHHCYLSSPHLTSPVSPPGPHSPCPHSHAVSPPYTKPVPSATLSPASPPVPAPSPCPHSHVLSPHHHPPVLSAKLSPESPHVPTVTSCLHYSILPVLSATLSLVPPPSPLTVSTSPLSPLSPRLHVTPCPLTTPRPH